MCSFLLQSYKSITCQDETYNDNELAQIKKRIDRLAEAFKSLTVIANNHYRGSELANAIDRYDLFGLLTTRNSPLASERTLPSVASCLVNFLG